MNTRAFAALFTATLLAPFPALRAWDDTGHQLVAAIAWSRLSPNSRAKLDLLFPSDTNAKKHIIFTPSKRKPTPEDRFPKTVYDHVTIASWMDDLRDNSYDKPLADWHFVDRPFFDGIEPKLAVPGSPNAREKIIEMIHELKKTRRFDSPEHRDDKTRAAYAAATLMHLIGDVHQPLHCVSRHSPGFEDGDMGGNTFKIDGPEKVDNLHSYWDGSGGLFGFDKLGRDFDQPPYKETLEKYLQRVLDRWKPADHPEWKNFNPEEWVEESFVLAKEKVYQGIKPTKAPDAAYEAKTQQLCAERIATAGYRLALVLNAIFDDK
jgi:hypothetical protein